MSGRINCDIVRTWQSAVEAVESGRLGEAVGLFNDIQHFSAKIWFNLSTVDVLQGNLEAAYEKLKECVQRDEYLVVAHFQRGVIACRQGRLTEAGEMFLQAEKYLRNSDSIDYKQLGMDLRLTRQQVLHNMAVLNGYLRSNRQTTEIAERDLETLPPVSLFRPARSLVDNIEKKKFLKSAKVISAVPEIDRNKHSNVVLHAKSFSAPTSPSAHRRLAPNPQPSATAAALTPPPSRPPPSRPPPRLLPPTLTSLPPSSSSTSSPHCHGNSASQVAGCEGQSQQLTPLARRFLPESSSSSSSSCLPPPPASPDRTFRAGGPQEAVARTRLFQGNPLHVETGSAGHGHGEGEGAVSVIPDRASNHRSISTCAPSPPNQSSDRLGTGRGSSPESSVADRIKRLEGSKSSQRQNVCGARSTSTCPQPGQDGEVKGERSWSEGGETRDVARSKPARPPPPKFVS